ncbi:MAG TPA: hypothetical protein VJS19_05200 [Candidatus Dormibacteraeota bacterium]|nr:hypothetical protein [Candidatus Dormibacteraeota bacterium]
MGFAASSTPGYFSSPLLLGAFALLLGIGAIMAALRRRRGRERYPETYAATGGIAYTAIQIGCGGVLLVAGVGLVILSLVSRG